MTKQDKRTEELIKERDAAVDALAKMHFFYDRCFKCGAHMLLPNQPVYCEDSCVLTEDEGIDWEHAACKLNGGKLP